MDGLFHRAFLAVPNRAMRPRVPIANAAWKAAERENAVGLDSVEILWAAEDAFHISISNEEASSMRTVGDLGRCVARKVAERASTPERPVAPEFDLIWPRLVELVVEEFGVPADRVRPETEWVRDLGAS